ncbi:MAG: hypothetical protein EBY57_10415, partial [Actinobacteria bacterium]|nr:hypothetical protein [Actinomycetota bacterium]
MVTASVSGSATLVGTNTATASNGVATFTDLGVSGTAGTYTLTFSSGALTVATQSITVTAGAAANIAINDGNNQTATVGSAVATAPSVIVTDAQGNAVQGTSVTFAVASGGGSLAPSGTVTTDASGIATSPAWTLGTTAGSNTLTATSSGLTGSPVTFTATGEPGTAARLVITGSATQTAGSSQDLTITARDLYNNTATAYSGDKSLTFSGASTAPDGTAPTVTDKDGNAVDFGDPTAITFTAGVATVPNGTTSNGAMTLYEAKTSAIDIQVTDGSISAAGIYDLSVTVSAATLDSFTVTTTTYTDISSKTAGESFEVRMRAVDEYLNIDGTFTGTVDLASSSTMIRGDGVSGAFTNGLSPVTTVSLTTAGSQTITATETGGSASGDSNAFTVMPGVGVNLAVASQPSGGQSGAALPTQPQGQVQDFFGNAVSAASRTVSVTEPSGETWSRLATTGYGGFKHITYGVNASGDGRWVAFNDGNDYFYYSDDGATWTQSAYGVGPTYSALDSISYGTDAQGDPQWMANSRRPSNNYIRVKISSDGSTWSNVTSTGLPSGGINRTLVYGNGVWM